MTLSRVQPDTLLFTQSGITLSRVHNTECTLLFTRRGITLCRVLNTEPDTLLFTQSGITLSRVLSQTNINTKECSAWSSQAHSYLHKGVLHVLECSTRSRAHSYLHKGVLHVLGITLLECSTRSHTHHKDYTFSSAQHVLSME